MMRGVIVRGTASEAFKGAPVMIAGKTGTTQDHRDAWFVGVTPHLAIGIWLGRDDNKPLPRLMAGGSSAAPIAVAILKQAHAGGLIDADGYRDSLMSSGLPWPPVMHENLAFQGNLITQERDSFQQDPVWSAADENPVADFWGSVDDQRSRPAPEVRFDESPANRNRDLINF